ncbi:hypothetical protein [Streptomyces sp. NPDC003247]|uniref:DUF7144 family membrane protein n=1 Tax=Streptomyces sp. NPDC003247 TaxID=3364677 RepID=UPI0036B31EC2
MTSHPGPSPDRPSPDPPAPGAGPQGEIGTAWSAPRGGPRRPSPRDARIAGGVAFAGVLLLCGGVLSVLQGIAALAGDEVYARIGSYVYALSLTAWGAVHVVLGVLAAVTGAGLLRGAAWARYPGVFLAALGLVAQFLFLPYEPLWSIVIMAVDVYVIWALTARTAG